MLDSIEKLEAIVSWYDKISDEPVRQLMIQKDFELRNQVEQLIGQKLPNDISSLYKIYDGESEIGLGSFLGHSFMNLKQISLALENCKTFIKPTEPKIPNTAEADIIINNIVKVYKRNIQQGKSFWPLNIVSNKNWYKIFTKCSPTSGEGPYLYPTAGTTDREREVLKLKDGDQDTIWALTRKLHELEKDSYHWDELSLTIYQNDRLEVEREFYNFDQIIPLTSTPNDCIKKKYFHIKWLPIIHDGCGNYIGIDLDPDTAGVIGQVIVFGRDEEDMFVISENWHDFLDILLSIIKIDDNEFLSHGHMHDILKQKLYPRL